MFKYVESAIARAKGDFLGDSLTWGLDATRRPLLSGAGIHDASVLTAIGVLSLLTAVLLPIGASFSQDWKPPLEKPVLWEHINMHKPKVEGTNVPLASDIVTKS